MLLHDIYMHGNIKYREFEYPGKRVCGHYGMHADWLQGNRVGSRHVVCKCSGIKVGYQNQIGVIAVSRTSQFSRQQQALPHKLCCVNSDVAMSHAMC